MEALGYHVLTASCAEELRSIICGGIAGNVGGLIIDQKLSQAHEGGLIPLFRGEMPHARVLLLSTDSHDIDLDENVEFLLKPFAAEDLGHRVDEFFRNWHPVAVEMAT